MNLFDQFRLGEQRLTPEQIARDRAEREAAARRLAAIRDQIAEVEKDLLRRERNGGR